MTIPNPQAADRPGEQPNVLEGIPPEMAAKALEAECLRCKALIVGAPSMLGTLMVNYSVPATGDRYRFYLCGECGIDFREFVDPKLLASRAFQALKANLLKVWGIR